MNNEFQKFQNKTEGNITGNDIDLILEKRFKFKSRFYEISILTDSFIILFTFYLNIPFKMK